MAYCGSISNTGLRKIAEYCTHIETLNLAGCQNITGEGLIRIGECCHELKNLDITGCSISDESLINVNKAFIRLKNASSMLYRYH
jgi:F-box/leucine-rich repeat protein 7